MTQAAVRKAINALGLSTPLDSPSAFEYHGRLRTHPIPATVIDIAALSYNPETFLYAVNLDRTEYGGAISAKSSPLCGLACCNHLDVREEVIAQMQLIIETGFDVSARQFSGNEEMCSRVARTIAGSQPGIPYEPLTPLEKACEALFPEAAELLVSEGARLGNAVELLSYYDYLDEENDQEMIEDRKRIEAALKNAQP